VTPATGDPAETYQRADETTATVATRRETFERFAGIRNAGSRRECGYDQNARTSDWRPSNERISKF
jgi:hypothetical protein